VGKLTMDEFRGVLSEDARRGLDQWLKAQPYKVEPVEWLHGGRSGSRVAVIARLGRGYDDQVAIKLARASEVNAWQAAISDCPEKFRKEHLVDIPVISALTSGADNNWWITILQIAGGDLSLFRPLAKLRTNKGPLFAKTCRQIVSSLIEDWNPAPREHSPESLSKATCLRLVFDSSRVVPEKPLGRFLESIEVALDDPFIPGHKPNRQLPNPLIFAANADQLDDRGQGGIHYGRAHADLNLGNILVPARRSPANSYKLIDLGGYNSKSPLARDPMHLLLSIALEWLNSGIAPGSQISRSLIEVIVKPNEETTDKEYRNVSQAIHGAGHDWASRLSWGREWTQQSLLFLVGCALRYASREIPGVKDANATRKWFFEVAALAARAYLEQMDLWGRYCEEFAGRHSHPPSSTAPAIPSGESDDQSSDSVLDYDSVPDGDSVSDSDSVSGQGSDESPDAQILPFRVSPKQRDRVSNVADSFKKGTWQDLVRALREATFDATDWYALAADTGPLLQEISRKRPSYPTADEEIAGHLRSLSETLTGVLEPATPRAKVRSACTRAKILRGWLLDLLTRSRS
jgi:hypothetical protein